MQLKMNTENHLFDMPAEAGAGRPSSACKLGRHNDVVFQNHFLLQFPHFETRVQASFIWTRVLVRADDEDDGRLPPQSRSASGEVYSLSFSNPTKLAFSSLPPPPILIFIQSTLIHCVSPHKLMWLLPSRGSISFQIHPL